MYTYQSTRSSSPNFPLQTSTNLCLTQIYPANILNPRAVLYHHPFFFPRCFFFRSWRHRNPVNNDSWTSVQKERISNSNRGTSDLFYKISRRSTFLRKRITSWWVNLDHPQESGWKLAKPTFLMIFGGWHQGGKHLKLFCFLLVRFSSHFCKKVYL